MVRKAKGSQTRAHVSGAVRYNPFVNAIIMTMNEAARLIAILRDNV